MSLSCKFELELKVEVVQFLGKNAKRVNFAFW